MKVFDNIVVGAGVIGLMQAYMLAKRGREVALIDRASFGKEASWAGGGILSPLRPWQGSDWLRHQVSISQKIYPKLAADLLAETGIDIEYRCSGLYFKGISDAAEAYVWAKKHNVAHHFDAKQPEDIFFPEIAQIRNPCLLKALKSAVKHLGVTCIENMPVNALILKSTNQCCGVRTATGDVLGRQTVLAAGAWTSQLLKGLSISLADVKPVKGQMLLFEGQPGDLNHILSDDDIYLIPRKDGVILAGSTVEHVGFDKAPTKQAYGWLYDKASQLLPVLSKRKLVAQWTGLRPATDSGEPVVGQVTGVDNLYLNTGHYRNGLVLAPATVKSLTAILSESVIETKIAT